MHCHGQWRIQDFNLKGVNFFLNFGYIFSPHSLPKRAKVHQWPKKAYNTFQTPHNASR